MDLNMFWFYDIFDEGLQEWRRNYEKILELKFHYLMLQD